MAAEPANSKQSKQDMQAHIRDYAGFTKLFLYGAIASFMIGLLVIFIIAD